LTPPNGDGHNTRRVRQVHPSVHPHHRQGHPRKGDAWVHEPKLDGYRFQIVEVRGRQVRLYSRSGYEWTKRLALLGRLGQRCGPTWKRMPVSALSAYASGRQA